MQISTISYLNENGVLSRECQHSIPEEVLVRGYETMLLTRSIDERMITLQRQGSVSFALSSSGEEACAVASAAALSMEDWMYPQYREVGVMFWRGYTVQQYLHHMFGNNEDMILGRQMPNHFGSKALNVVPVSSPIGTQIPHAAGCAYAMKIHQEKAIAIAYFGEGATSEGDFHVGLNFAAVRKVPAIFFCRNNGYAISTPCANQFASDGIYPKGIGYGVQAFRVDGNDFFAIHETVSKAKQLCLEGKGPILIEAMTYRLGAHSTSDDPSRYRAEEEAKAWETKCPIRRLRLYLESKKLWNTQKEEAFLAKSKKEIDEAIETAKKTEPPPLSSLIRDVYFEIPQRLKEEFQAINQLYGERG
ncbi:thiamine pyrophosphate-dependent enzyme [Parachlamydia sp. AcF125]|uniref:thiamine pyrophosphate-dependent dehydrogenase E1 component subunit alpha n=1 Tax=Parachlamydia sp. AcF125 TaxID=2795736 RepID=UPI001BCA29FC|nr:thiamine pyrophosphate-dependent enzyme [Parachlamydia sp. AcF125]MBS4167939.1 Pyruvate dehydrogenase E1 component subunit alpha [Parachlamydia sp. AcF125]